MTEATPKNGHVIHYDYLWRREFERGEESGRKTRPVCVTVVLPGRLDVTRILVFPITSQPPGPHRIAMAVPDTELRRVGLRGPAWVVLDESNTDLWEGSFHVVNRTPMGRFSYVFFDRLRSAALGQLNAGRLRPVPRR
jgi:hypothetical protein